MARNFLTVIAITIGLFVAIGSVLVINRVDLTLWLIKPDHDFADQPVPPAPDYLELDSWSVHPEGHYPEIYETGGSALATEVDVFYLHPTTYLNPLGWNAPIDDEGALEFLYGVVEAHQITPFSASARVFAPFYRQATLAALREDNANGRDAVALAYSDVLRAFDTYLAQWNSDRPLIIAAHSQGTFHALKLLRDRVSGTALAENLIAAYLLGRPVSLDHDLPALPDIPACEAATQTGCIISWNTYMKGGSTSDWFARVEIWDGLDGLGKTGSPALCTNPLSWRVNRAYYPAHNNLGSALILEAGTIEIADLKIGAQCGADGGLYVDDFSSDDFNTRLLPDGNLHLYDFALFYMNIRQNAHNRIEAFLERRGRPEE